MSSMKLFKAKQAPVPGPSREEALDARPVANSWVEVEKTEDGLIRLGYPVTHKPWFARIAKLAGHPGEYRGHRRLELDQMGSAAWGMIDGRNSVRELVQEFVVRYGIHEREAEAAMTTFIRELGRRGLIGLR